LKFYDLALHYELWMIRNSSKTEPSSKEDTSIQWKDVWEQTRNKIRRNEFNYEKIPELPFYIWAREDEIKQFPMLEKQNMESLELEKTLLLMVPYFKTNTPVALLYTVFYLDKLIKGLGKKYESKILSIRAKVTNEIETKSQSGCYVATCCYKDYNAPEVVLFRLFRDTYLMNRVPGRKFVKYYYRFSPSLVTFLKTNRIISLVVKKAILQPIYLFLRARYSVK
jgi:hypothetical protein